MAKAKKTNGDTGATKSVGRPPESPNRQYDQVTVPASRCTKCQSTDRTNYTQRRIIRGHGVDPVVGPFNVVVLRPTRCAKCGQWRNDRTPLLTDGELSDEQIDALLGM